jgi:hypothetical protein
MRGESLDYMVVAAGLGLAILNVLYVLAVFH